MPKATINIPRTITSFLSEDCISFDRMSATLKCERNFLKFLSQDCISKDQGFALLSTVSNLQVKAITEIFHNLIYSNLDLPSELISHMTNHKKIYKQLARRSNLPYKRRIIRDHYLLILEVLYLLRNLLPKIYK